MVCKPLSGVGCVYMLAPAGTGPATERRLIHAVKTHFVKTGLGTQQWEPLGLTGPKNKKFGLLRVRSSFV